MAWRETLQHTLQSMMPLWGMVRDVLGVVEEVWHLHPAGRWAVDHLARWARLKTRQKPSYVPPCDDQKRP